MSIYLNLTLTFFLKINILKLDFKIINFEKKSKVTCLGISLNDNTILDIIG